MTMSLETARVLILIPPPSLSNCDCWQANSSQSQKTDLTTSIPVMVRTTSNYGHI